MLGSSELKKKGIFVYIDETTVIKESEVVEWPLRKLLFRRLLIL